ncbi:MAG: hypothetical protein LC749_06585 [Actinobacteria bacterium]|nr:hypothetical protein [Actinomycetota bacterium]
MLLLYSHAGPIAETDLRAWVEHTNASVYRRDILRPAHKAKLIEYDSTIGTVELSPLGVQFVEQNLPLSLVA